MEDNSYDISRRDFLKKTGFALGSLVLGNSLNSRIAKGSSYKDVTDQIPEGSQEEFINCGWCGTLQFDDDEGYEEFLSADKEEGSLIKIYPLNDADIPLSMNFDGYDKGFGFVTTPNINIYTVSARQMGKDLVKFKMNLRRSPLDLPEEYMEEFSDSEKPLEYAWRIDTDKSKKTGESKVGRWADEETEFYIGAECNVVISGDGENWEATLVNNIDDEEFPLEDFDIVGNEVEATVNLKYLGNPKSFNFGGWTRSPESSPQVADGNRFEDQSPEPIPGESNFFGAKTPSPEDFSPGTFEVDPGYRGNGDERITKIYHLPSHIEEVGQSDEIPRVLILHTGDTKFLLDYHKEDVRIREKV